MAKQLFVNNFTSTFIANVNSSASTGTPSSELGYGILQLNSGASAYLVNPTGGDYYILTAYKRSGSVESNVEIMKVTAVDNTVINECRITVLRAQEGTSAQAYVPGDYISLRITKGGLANMAQPADLATKQDLIGTISGLVKGDGANALTAAVAETDYVTPSGAGTLQNKTLASPSVTGDVLATGTGQRYKADFSNATASLRYMYQTTTVNGNTIVSALPNGTGNASYFQTYNSSDLTNASYAYIGITGSIATINSGKLGAGTALPLVFAVDSTERMRIDTAGNVGIGVTPDATGRLSISGAASGVWPSATSGLTLNGATSGTSTITSYLDSSAITIGAGVTQKTGITINGQTSAAGSSIEMRTGNATRATLDASGNLILATGSLQEKKQSVAASNIDISTGNYFTKTVSGSTTLTVSNVPASGTVAAFVLDLTNGGSSTVTWWSGVKWAAGSAPTLTASGRDVLGFFTHDGGTTWTGLVLAKDAK